MSVYVYPFTWDDDTEPFEVDGATHVTRTRDGVLQVWKRVKEGKAEPLFPGDTGDERVVNRLEAEFAASSWGHWEADDPIEDGQ